MDTLNMSSIIANCLSLRPIKGPNLRESVAIQLISLCLGTNFAVRLYLVKIGLIVPALLEHILRYYAWIVKQTHNIDPENWL